MKQALLLVAGKKYFKFSIAICINCMENMLIWGHFRGIMGLLLHNYLGHGDILIIEKTFVSVFIESAKKGNILVTCWCPKCPGIPNATDQIGGNLNVSMNQGYQSPLQRVASWSFQCAICTGPSGGGLTSMLGQINLKLMKELGCSKRLTGNCTIMNS